ncbi:MAG: DUF2076 domain-containing protein [Methylobacteriaceae bacterium]|nr:DUF2076 domain-containing protein [Methylobacteriaceae bacterium]
MTPDERQMLAGLFDRVRDAARNPRDAQAEAYIAERVREAPHAAYALAQAVLVQDQALAAADERIRQLEAELREAEQARPQQGGGFLGGAGRSIFGDRAAPPAPAAPANPWSRAPAAGSRFGEDRLAPPAFGAQPAAQGGPWANAAQPAPARGGGFLAGALGAAAGVAGGMLLANSIGSLFGGGKEAGAGHGAPTALSGHGDGGSSGDLPPLDRPFQPDATYQDAGYDPGSSGGFDDGGGFDGGDSMDV